MRNEQEQMNRMRHQEFLNWRERTGGTVNVTDLDNWFSYHAPQPDQVEKYERIRKQARALANTILDCTQQSADQTAAIRKVREAVMTANAAIACGGR